MCSPVDIVLTRVPSAVGHSPSSKVEGGQLNSRGTIAVAAIAALLSVACASAPRNPVLDNYPPGVSGRTSVFYYDVHGRTAAELFADMRRLGPKLDGSSFVGETRSPMQWNWRTESTGAGGCVIRNITVSVNAQITLPRWTPPPDTEPGLATEWSRFIAALETHEAGHKDIAARAGHEIVEQLRGLSGLCAQLSNRANDLAGTIVARANVEQKTYDATTRHGLTQGTAFGARRSTGMSAAGTVRGFVPAPLDRTWTALPAAYAASDLTINVIDSSAYAVGDSITTRGTIGRVAVSDVLDCGSRPTGRNADSVDVAIFVTSRLEASQSPGTMVMNAVQAVARPTGSPPIACRSRGVIERRILDALRSQLSR